MTLSISNCGDFYLEESKGFLPTTCDDAFYLSPGKKQVLETTDHETEEYFDSREGSSFSGPERTTRPLLSTTIRSLSHRRTRGPLRYTQSPEVRQQSFQLLLRMHTNRFNQRLGMLESNTLDMKDSLENIRKQHSRFSSQLKMLPSVLSPNEQKDRINDMASKYTDIKTRLSKLEHKLEILIDGFTALAQELDKVKRARHAARPPQDRRETAVVATTLIPVLTTAWITRMSTSVFQRRPVIPKTLPTPRTISMTSFASGHSQMNESSTKSQVKFSTKGIQPVSTSRHFQTNFTSKADKKYHSKSSRRSTVPKGIVSRPLTTFSKRTSNETQQNQQKRKAPTEVSVTPQKHYKYSPKVNGKSQNATRKHDQLSRSPTKPQVKEESATKFQIPPPSHAKIAAESSKPSSKPQKGGHVPSKESSKSMKAQGNNLEVKPSKTATNISKPSHNVQTKTRHSKTKSSKQNKFVPSHDARGASDFRSGQAEEFAYTTASSKSTDKKRLHSTKPKVKITTPGKSARSNASKTVNILDLFMRSNRSQKTLTRSMLKRKKFHIVLGRLAIPIKIIPDY